MKFIIMSITGVQGCEYYDTHAAALKAAKFRTSCSGIPWYVTAVYHRAN